MTPKRPGGTARPAASVRPNTLGISEKDLGRLLDELDAGPGASANPRRLHSRWPYREQTIAIRIDSPNGGSVDLRMACRNLSCGGIGLLHNAFLYTGTKCVVILPRAIGGFQPVSGEIVRCQHRRGMIHEIGVKFAVPIEVRDFIRNDLLESRSTVEQVDAESLTGVVLYANSLEVEQHLFRSFLRETRVRIKSATSAEQAEQLILSDQSINLLVCDQHLPDRTGLEMITKLALEGVQLPVIITSADTGPGMRQALADAPKCEFMPKPLQKDRVLRSLSEYLKPAEKGASGRGDDEATLAEGRRKLCELFAPEAAQLSAQLEKYAEKNEAMPVYTICLQLKGTAPALGLDDMASTATSIADTLSGNMNLVLVQTQLKRLITLCKVAGREPRARHGGGEASAA